MIFVAVAHVHTYTTFTEIPIKEKENVLRLNEVSVTNGGLDTRNASGTRFYESSMAIDNGLYSISLSLFLFLSSSLRFLSNRNRRYRDDEKSGSEQKIETTSSSTR